MTDTPQEKSVLDALAGNIATFSKFAARKTLEGYYYTKMAVRGVMRPFGHLSTGHFTRNISIRQMFKFKHSRQLGDAAKADDELSEESEEDEDANASVEQLYHKVDRKFFSPQFDPAKSELECLRVTYAEDQAAVELEIKELQDHINERQTPLNVVNKVLKKRILGNYAVFLQGVCEVAEVNEELKRTGHDCTKGRELLAQSKDVVVRRGLRIAQLERRRQNLARLLDTIELVQIVRTRNQEFAVLLESGNFKQAIRMTQSARMPGEDALEDLAIAKDGVSEWAQATSDRTYIREYLNRAGEDCIHQKYDERKYEMTIEGFFMLDDPPKAASDVVGLALWHAATRQLPRCVGDFSAARDGDDLKVLARGVLPENIVPCSCRLGAKALDFLALFRSIINLHDNIKADAKTSNGATYINFHRAIRSTLLAVGTKIGDLWHLQIGMILQGIPLHALDLDKVLHVFHVFKLLTEATALFGCTAEKMTKARDSVKESLTNHITKLHLQSWRGSLHILNRMKEDTFRAEPSITPSMFKSIAPLSPRTYLDQVKRVKRYALTPNEKRNPAENPFLTEEMMIMHDVTRDVDVTSFSRDIKYPVVTSASVAVANFVFEFLIRVAVRFPPIASEVIDWSEELVALYFYVGASNLIPCTAASQLMSEPALEDEADITMATKQVLRNLREMTLSCAPHLAMRSTERKIFPEILGGTIGEIVGCAEFAHGLRERLTAVASVFPLIGLLSDALSAVSPLITQEANDKHSRFLDALEPACEEVLHVLCHRMSFVLLGIESLIEVVAKTKYERSEMAPSAYTEEIVPKVRMIFSTWHGYLPSEAVERIFWQHFLLVIEQGLLRGYSKVQGFFHQLSITDVSQMRVDVQFLGQEFRRIFRGQHIVWGDYVDGFLRAFFTTWEEQLQWIKANHKQLLRSDVVAWFSQNKETRREVEMILDTMSHEDSLVLADRAQRLSTSPRPK